MQEKPPDLESLIRALIEKGARVVLVGGYAMIAHGANTETRDVDFAFAREKQTVRAIVEALAPFRPFPREFPAGLPFVWDELSVSTSTLMTLQTTAGKIDLLGETPGVETFEELYRSADTINLYGFQVKVACMEHLIAMKRAAGRQKDLDHLQNLENLRREKLGLDDH